MILMNPGPVNVTPRVRKALTGPDICHREPEFAALLSRVRTKLLNFLDARRSHRLAIFSGSGTTALEAMLCSFADRKKKTLVLSNGVYGERIRRILTIHRAGVVYLEAPLGRFPSEERIEAALKADRSIESIAMVHHETSTGMLNPLSKVCELAAKHGKFMIVDAISSLGAERLDLSKVDLCAGTSGKCLHGFPGISFVLLSKKAAAALLSREPRSISLDLRASLEHTERDDTAFTPAVQVLYALEAALDEALKETLAGRIRRYRALSGLLHRGMSRLGLRFLLEAPARSHVLTAFWTPPSVPYEKLHDELKRAGFVIYAGQSALKGRIFRVANLGAIRPADLRRFLKSFERILRNGR